MGLLLVNIPAPVREKETLSHKATPKVCKNMVAEKPSNTADRDQNGQSSCATGHIMQQLSLDYSMDVSSEVLTAMGQQRRVYLLKRFFFRII